MDNIYVWLAGAMKTAAHSSIAYDLPQNTYTVMATNRINSSKTAIAKALVFICRKWMSIRRNLGCFSHKASPCDSSHLCSIAISSPSWIMNARMKRRYKTVQVIAITVFLL